MATSFWGCMDTEGGSTGPSAADFEAERARLAALQQKMEGNQAKRAATPGTAPPGPGESQLGDGFGMVGADYAYDSRDKRDPFRSFRFRTGEEEGPDEPLGPLEHFELGQLSVSAVIWETNRARALVQDPAGDTFVVQEGTRIGKNNGRVIHIGDNLVLVKETYVDFAGEQTTKDVELRIRTNQGG